MQTKSIFLLTVLSCLLFQGYSDLSIVEPAELKKWWDDNPSLAVTSVATFGHIPWGSKKSGELILADPLNACDVIRPRKDKPEESYSNTILVAKRGDCSFVMKTHYAQLAQAKMLLILDDREEDVALHLMVDKSGNGDSVKIPAALVSKRAGEQMLHFLKDQNKTVRGTFDFNLTKMKTFEYSLWLSSASPESFKFISRWADLAKKLESDAKLIPRFYHETDNFLGDDHCVCKKYCAKDPDADGQNTGVDAMIEDLRQMCILKIYSKEHWYAYMGTHHTFCFNGANMTACGNTVAKMIKLDTDKINDCIKGSFDVFDMQKCSKNQLLEEQREFMTKEKVYYFPSVTVNGFPVRGSIFPIQNVLESLCMFFTSMPSVCTKNINFSDEDEVPASHFGMLMGIALSILVLLAVIFYCLRRAMRREMYSKINYDINQIMQQYTQLKDDKHDAPEEL